MEERASRKALVVVAGLLVLVLVFADLARQGSLIRSGWRALTRPETPIERVLDGILGRGSDRSGVGVGSDGLAAAGGHGQIDRWS